MVTSIPPVPAPPEPGEDLYSELDQSLGHLVRRSLQLHTATWAEVVGSDLTPTQYTILDAVAAAGSLDQQGIGRATSLDRSTVADVLSRLERNAWVQRDRDPAPGRRLLFQPTPPARLAVGLLRDRAGEAEERLLAPLDGAERAELVALLTRAAVAGPAAPGPEQTGTPLTAGQLLRRAEQMHQRVWTQIVGPLATPPQYAVFCALHGNALDQRTLAALASLDTSSTADIVSRLVRQQLLVAERDPADRRRSLVALTGGAVSLLRTLTPLARSVHEAVSASLTGAETDRLMDLLRRIGWPGRG